MAEIHALSQVDVVFFLVLEIKTLTQIVLPLPILLAYLSVPDLIMFYCGWNIRKCVFINCLSKWSVETLFLVF